MVEESSLASTYQANTSLLPGDAEQPPGAQGAVDARESVSQFKPEELKRKENAKEEVKGDV